MSSIFIANTELMIEQGLNKEYELYDKVWINQHLSCGCLVALCVSETPSQEDNNIVSKLFVTSGSARTMIKILSSASEEKIQNKLFSILETFQETQEKLLNFITTKRKELNFPVQTDFNGQYYYIKLKADPECSEGRNQ